VSNEPRRTRVERAHFPIPLTRTSLNKKNG
jgi:hypothetical protein